MIRQQAPDSFPLISYARCGVQVEQAVGEEEQAREKAATVIQRYVGVVVL